MVKAGVLLMAVAGPAFVDVATWKWHRTWPLAMASMMWGAESERSPASATPKLILAWGTVSQLGLLVTLLSLGTAKATFAAVSILFAHALFKAALFLVVGEIDIRTGTRDIEELGGLARSMPMASRLPSLAGLSMAGAPPLLGFTAKEAAVEAVLGLAGWVELVVGGRGRHRRVGPDRCVHTCGSSSPSTSGRGSDRNHGRSPARPLMTVPAVVLGGCRASSASCSSALAPVNEHRHPGRGGAQQAKADVYSLIAWPGLTTAFLVSSWRHPGRGGVLLGWLVIRQENRYIDRPEPHRGRRGRHRMHRRRDHSACSQ